MRSSAMAIVCCMASVSAAAAENRAWSLVNSFQVMCGLPGRSFDRSSEQALAMKLPVIHDVNVPKKADGTFIRSKAWVLPLKDGPHMFGVTEGLGPKGAIATCTIGDNEIASETFKAELVSQMKLGNPTKAIATSDGGKISWWEWAGRELMLKTPAPNQQNGFVLILSDLRKSEM